MIDPCKKTRTKRLLLLAAVALMAMLAAGCASVDPGALRNVAEYQIRKTFPPVFVWQEGSQPPAGALRGTVRDAAGNPLPGALVLVSTVRGETTTARTDTAGTYLLANVPAGRVTPMAAAWGYDAVNGPPVRVGPGSEVSGVDFVLPARSPAPVMPTDLRIGGPVQAASDFPEPMVATRIPFTFTQDGVTVDVGQIYLPVQQARSETGPSDGANARSENGNPPGATGLGDRPSLPTLFIVYPSRPLNWDAASVGLTRDGFTVLAVGPDGDRGLDMEGHIRDMRAAMQLWVDGKLPIDPPGDNWVLLSGSFGSLIVYPALQDLPVQPPRMVDIGGVSDAFLGVQALYSTDLEIPPPYDSAVAALGRPDRDPAFFYQFSPALDAAHLPPTFVVHMLNDPVIPHNQALALIDALDAARVPHESLLYEDTTHYLDAYNPTPGTGMVFERVLDYVEGISLP
ncbi:MAG: carboxypeptidase regulatory-like domain-containing protein [Caldilineales bacterium]